MLKKLYLSYYTMSVVVRLCDRNSLRLKHHLRNVTVAFLSSNTANDNNAEHEEEFRVLKLIPDKKDNASKQKRFVFPSSPPRSTEMAVDQDWPSVWPAQRTFHPAVVPLPIRQGYPMKGKPVPGKYANTELMKIPNFLHLTPPAIRRHCEAIKKFCTPWPEGLEDDEKCEYHFPLEVISSDYLYSSPSIREPLARIVTYRVKLSSLKLDMHSKDKLLRLLGHRYDPETNYITIVADRCPVRKQNSDYAKYLLTAVYNESLRKEAWESEKTDADMEYYDWETNQSKSNLITLYAWPQPPTDVEYEKIPHVSEYKVAVSDLINNGEDEYAVEKYKNVVKQILNIKSDLKDE